MPFATPTTFLGLDPQMLVVTHAIHAYLVGLMGNPRLVVAAFLLSTILLTRTAVGAMERLERG